MLPRWYVVAGFSRTDDSRPSVDVTLAVPDRSNATPSIASDGAFVAVAWGASLASGATDIFLATSRDGGRTFGTTVRVNDKDGDARVNGEQPPRVVLQHADPPIVTVVWTTKGEKGTRLVYARSDDGGRSFTRAATVPGGDAPGNRGWEAVAVTRSGVNVVWLDHRELAAQDSSMAAMHHQHSGEKPDGVAMAQKSKLYLAAVDGSTAPQAITGGVCYCCKTALATGADGSVFAAWRHVYPGNIRDIAFTSSRDGGRTFTPPVRVSEDKWELEGCPDDGPTMAIDAHNRIHIVWPTLVKDAAADTIALFYASSSDGRTFTARERSDRGMPHHPQITIASDGSLVLAWDELAGGTRRAAFGRATLKATGRPTFAQRIFGGGEPAVYPVVAPIADAAIVAAWTSGRGPESVIRVERH